MTKLEKLYSIIENSRDVGVKLPKGVLQQVEELEEGIIKEEILPALSGDIAPRLERIKRDLVLVVEYHPGEPISVALSRKAKISEIMGAKKHRGRVLSLRVWRCNLSLRVWRCNPISLLMRAKVVTVCNDTIGIWDKKNR